MPPLLYWALENLVQTQIYGGFTIETDTDVACHQWLRHTLTSPQKHAKAVTVRGLITTWDARFCFVAFDDLEQNEAGDTFHHTFTWTGWKNCQTRYFYFWATSFGEPMKSTSPLFSKHFQAVPITVRLYSDPHPEVTTVDGHTAAFANYPSWAAIVAAAGDQAADDTEILYVILWASATPNQWVGLWRPVHLFDGSVIPPGVTITAATLSIYGESKRNDFPWTPALAVYKTNPFSNTGLIGTDYSRFFSTILSNKISYPDFSTIGFNTFTLNSDGLAAITPGEVIKLGIREANYDAGPLTPGWQSLGYIQLGYYSVEKGTIYRPYLDVTYE